MTRAVRPLLLECQCAEKCSVEKLVSPKLTPGTIIGSGLVGMLRSPSLVWTATHGEPGAELVQSPVVLGTKVPKNVFDATMLIKDSVSMAGMPVAGLVTGSPLNKSGMLVVE